jgi:hypothetical protein
MCYQNIGRSYVMNCPSMLPFCFGKLLPKLLDFSLEGIVSRSINTDKISHF